jgi:hypothetical protein
MKRQREEVYNWITSFLLFLKNHQIFKIYLIFVCFIRYMEEYTTKDLAEALHSLADVWEDFAEYCELRADQIMRELQR